MTSPSASSAATQEKLSLPTAPERSTKREADFGSTLSTGRNLVLLQLLSRLLTFVLNQSLVRLAPPEVFGTAAIQFDLVYSTILFLSREGIRNALLRSSIWSTPLSRLPFKLGLVVSTLSIGVYLFTSDRATTGQNDFYLALGLYVLSALVELGVEPLYIRTLRSIPPKLGVRVQAEGGMAVIKALVTFTSLVLAPRRALLGFALGQLGGDVWLASRYIFEYGVSALTEGSAADVETYRLAMANTRQSVIKHVLTEGDRIVVGQISPLGDQAGYAIAINYGSLIARIIFQPVEETLLLHFSRSLSSPATRHLLTYILHISLHLLLFLPAYLPPILLVVLPLLLPARYRATTASATLETYLAYYIPLLSLNGILEAFHAASASPAQVAKQARWMFISSATFASGLWSMTTYRPLALHTEQFLILASCLSMGIRIAFASVHAKRFFSVEPGQEGLKLWEVSPHPVVIGVAMSGAKILRSRARDGVVLSAPTVVLGVVTVAVLCIVEWPRFKRLRRTMSEPDKTL